MDALRLSALCIICSYVLVRVDGIIYKQMTDDCGSRINAYGEHQLLLYFLGSRDCVVTIATTSTFPWKMLYFENFAVSCNLGSVSIRNIYGRPPNGLDRDLCGYVYTSEVYTTKGDIKIKYTPKTQWINGSFTLILTPFSDSYSCPSYGHVCDNGRCINAALKCNGYNSCGDNSGCLTDSSNLDHTPESHKGTGVDGVGIGVGVAVGVIVIIVVSILIICWRRKRIRTPAQQARPSAPPMQVVYSSTAQPGQFNQGFSHELYGIYMHQTAASLPQATTLNDHSPPPYDSAWAPKQI
ncbi:uncharacterized protein LOC127845728 [Dreissena polymorpha]|nr:uncharacterized protein LOC127845728 [Dreissena polymorpha]